jgi:hypothetical protein
MRFGATDQPNRDRNLDSHGAMGGSVGHDPLKKSQGASLALVRATSYKAGTWENTIGNSRVTING